ncbi:hypothetical protein KC19_7G037900 [Ceratodon purpureus]|uniref:Uncharacterized protein n=1 Tax=Ceratodon purpureus TaxID=3225 RepID=A0A8T0H1V8_CERPU|nr:hypothetical protein KC19_7G037900 [Ceratodon purpureus]
MVEALAIWLGSILFKLKHSPALHLQRGDLGEKLMLCKTNRCQYCYNHADQYHPRHACQYCCILVYNVRVYLCLPRRSHCLLSTRPIIQDECMPKRYHDKVIDWRHVASQNRKPESQHENLIRN